MKGFHLCCCCICFGFFCSFVYVLVNFNLFLVTIVLFHSPVSSTNKGCKRCYANSSGKQRSQWFMEDEDHCMLPWLCGAGLSWSDCPSEWKETAFSLSTNTFANRGHTPLHSVGIAAHLIFSSLLWFYLRFSFTPWNGWICQCTLHTLSRKGQILPTFSYSGFRLQTREWNSGYSGHATFVAWYLLIPIFC